MLQNRLVIIGTYMHCMLTTERILCCNNYIMGVKDVNMEFIALKHDANFLHT